MKVSDKKRITWITADYFIDVDLPIIPNLLQFFDIDWVILKGNKSKIEIPKVEDCKQQIIEAPYRAKDPRIIKYYRGIIKNIKNTNPDLIYVDFLGTPFFYPVLLKMILNVPIIHAAHNVIPYDGWPDKRLMTWYVNYIFKNNNYFHLFSSHLLSYFREKYINKKCFYAPLSLKDYGSVSTDVYEVDTFKVNLLFFGGIKANKRLDLLIEAIKQLPKEITDKLNLTIAGACDKREEKFYIELIDSHSSIKFYFKRIPDEEVAELFCKHDFLVLPYEDVAQSGPHMIAYNYNMPVIATNIAGFKERVENQLNGFLFNANDLEDLKNVLCQVANQSSIDFEKMKNELSDYVKENLSQEVVLEEYVKFFNSITK